MLKKRIIGVVLVRNGIAVQSIGFRRFLPIGRPEIAIEFLDRWGVDEIVLLETDATSAGETPAVEAVRSFALRCQVPLAVGGGISSVDDVTRIIQAGADKVVINSAGISDPEMVRAAAVRFGAQCIVASIDARREDDGTYMAYTHGGRVPTNRTASDVARGFEKLGVGEILLASIDRDGSKQGYDLDLMRSVVSAVTIPVIGCGGAGHPDHLRAAMQTGVAAVAAGNFLHFTEHSVIVIKRMLVDHHEPVRLDTYASYDSTLLDSSGRVAKRSDDVLEAMRFRYIPEEVI